MQALSIILLCVLAISKASTTSDSWAFLTTELADIYISEFARSTLNIQKGQLFKLYQSRKELENYEHEILFESDADVNKANIEKIIEEDPSSCNQDTGCLPLSFTTVSQNFLQWCSDIRNGRYEGSSISSRSNLGQMTSLFIDLHNPLHISYVGDDGGSNCNLNIETWTAGGSSNAVTLRDLWDTEIVESILSPSKFNDPSVTQSVVNALHTFIQENIQEIENDGALNTFQDIFTHKTFTDMIEVWMMYTHNITRLCYEFDGKTQTACDTSKTVTPDTEYIDRAKHLLQIQIGVAGLRLGSFVNRAATAAMSSEYNQTYSLIWTVILCGIFLSGLVMWIVLYPRLKRQFSRARSDSDEYHAFSERVLQNHEDSYGDSGIRSVHDDEASYSYLSD